jgi:UDP-glucuronate 4-epimerase
MKIIVTGSSGFIGMNLCIKLLKLRHEVVGIDNMNSYYDVNLKKKKTGRIKKI